MHFICFECAQFLFLILMSDLKLSFIREKKLSCAKYGFTTFYFYRPQRSCGKVMFSQASVILFTGGVSVPACTTGHMTRGVSVQGVSVQGGLCTGGLCLGVFCPECILVPGMFSLGAIGGSHRWRLDAAQSKIVYFHGDFRENWQKIVNKPNPWNLSLHRICLSAHYLLCVISR